MTRKILTLIIVCLTLGAASQSCFDAGDGSDGAFNATSNTTLAGGTYDFTSFSISPGVTVNGTGAEPLIIRVTGDVIIEGTLSVKGGNGGNGVVNVTYGGGGIGVAGGANGGAGSYNNFNMAATASWGNGIGGGGAGEGYGGGGGGGYGSDGTSSGNTIGGGGGSAYGNAELTVLYAGSGGGGGSGGFGGGGGGGGAGGGAIEINCGGTVTIAAGGTINANGGNGGAAGTHVGGGGGGAGGAIVIKSVSVINDGLITAVGGTGGNSQAFVVGRIGGNGGLGRIKIDHENPISGNGIFNPAIGSEQSLLTPPVVQAMVLPGNEVCEGTSVTLFAEGNVSSYAWSDGVTDGEAFTATEGGWYVVTASAGGACIAVDSILLSVVTNPPLNPFVLPGTTVCAGESITLSGGGNAAFYTWSDGVEDGMPFVPESSGTYVVTATNGSICTSTASIDITVNPNPVVDLGADIETLSVPVTLDAGSGFASYLWNTEEETQTISVTSSGTYSVTVLDENGCSGTDSIEVTVLVGIDEADISAITVYPNPASDMLRFTTDRYIQAMRICNTVGAVVRQLPHTERTISVADLSPGLYYIEFTTDGMTQKIPFIKE